MILTMTLNPAIDKTVEIKGFEVGTVNRVSSIRLDAGGKGINVSKVVKSLGGYSKAIGILGNRNGSFIKDYLNGLWIENEFVFVEGETRTNLKIIDTIRKIITDINEPGPYVSEKDIEKIESILLKNIKDDTIVVFTGSVPINTDSKIYGKWIKTMKKMGIKSILDADGELLKEGIKEGPFLIKPNIHELESLFGEKINSIKEAARFGKSLLSSYDIENVVISLGEKGAVFINKKSSIFAHAIKVDIKSTVGAGDAMVAALAYCIDMGYDFNKTVSLSMAAAIANTMTSGTQAADYDSIVNIERQIKFETIFDQLSPL